MNNNENNRNNQLIKTLKKINEKFKVILNQKKQTVFQLPKICKGMIFKKAIFMLFKNSVLIVKLKTMFKGKI